MNSRQLLSRRQFLQTSAVVAGGLLNANAARAGDQKRPNILWITCEDTGPELGCYGDEYAVTPNLDAFAAQAMRYQVAWSTAPVCAPARTTIISGVYPTRHVTGQISNRVESSIHL